MIVPRLLPFLVPRGGYRILCWGGGGGGGGGGHIGMEMGACFSKLARVSGKAQ